MLNREDVPTFDTRSATFINSAALDHHVVATVQCHIIYRPPSRLHVCYFNIYRVEMVGQALFYDTDVVELHMGFTFKPVNKACIVFNAT